MNLRFCQSGHPALLNIAHSTLIPMHIQYVYVVGWTKQKKRMTVECLCALVLFAVISKGKTISIKHQTMLTTDVGIGN